MELGPIELVVLKFPGNNFKGEIIPELKHLVESKTIRIVDIIFVRKDTDGGLTVLEIDDLDPDLFSAFDPVVEDITGLLSREDAETFGAALDANSSAAVMLFEDRWATRLVEAIRNADGEVVLAERVPRAVMDELLAGQPA
jgi:hypothetical protein